MQPASRAPALQPQEVVGAGLCVGCGSCVAQGLVPGGQMVMNRHGLLQPDSPAARRAPASDRLARTCPASPHAADETTIAQALFPAARQADALVGRFEGAYVGHVAEGEFRTQGSSGGIGTWVASELLRRGLVDGVAHVAATGHPQADGRFFRYRISRTPEQLAGGAKSRYYPVEMSAVLAAIRSTPGRYAVVGIPCFIKAVQLLRREDPVLRERIVHTIGLFCGHMKSARFLESFATQLGVDLKDVRRVDYRRKDANRPANWYTVQLTLHDGRTVQQDWFHLAEGDWGSGFFQNTACNFCDDVVAETADLSLGDAWVDPYSQDGRGTNVVLVRSPLLHGVVEEAIRDGRLALQPVDAAFVQRTQAAGLRHRREGLAYRLTWRRGGLQPRKRVQPDARSLPPVRKFIYRMRALITRWSPPLFLLAKRLRLQRAYLAWARGAVALYQGAAYSRGALGRVLQRVGLAAR